MNDAERNVIRIFISSPGDVAEERDKARLVIDELQRDYGVQCQAVLWEDLALPATASFQETIELILHQHPIDIAVFILWSRLGSPLGAGLVREDGSRYRSGTEREFDLMLGAFEQSGRKRPVILAYTREDEAGWKHRVTNAPKDQLEEFVAQQKLVETFIREQFHDSEGRNVRAYNTYREPISFAQRLHTQLRQVLDVLLTVNTTDRVWRDEPYRGLQVFDIEHARIFYGRDQETCELQQRLRDQAESGCAFVVIVGASGSGKSSLARAGVASALTRHAFDESVHQWRAVTFLPGSRDEAVDGGLLLTLVNTLAEAVPELQRSSSLNDIASGLGQDAPLTVRLSVTPAFSREAEQAGGPVRVLLLLDQMEELWTDGRITADDRERFLSAIEALARSGTVHVLATLRSDFYPQAQLSPAFLRLKGDHGHYDLVSPGPGAIQKLITEPARMAGLRFERNEQTGQTLDQLIVHDALHDRSALPLLQYTLGRLYDERDDATRTLTFSAYHQLGGVEGALGRCASSTVQALPDDARAALSEVLPHLVTIDVLGEQSAVRRRARLVDLQTTAARRTLVDALIAARFLTSDRHGDVPIVSLAHEALLRRWNELALWVERNREHLRLRARAEQSHQRWLQQGSHSSLFLPAGLPSEEGQILLREARELLTEETCDYIERSIKYRHAEAKRQRLVRTAAMAFSLTAAVIAIVAAVWINTEREAAIDARNLETTARTREQQQRQLAQESENRAIQARDELMLQLYDNAIAIAEREITQNHDIGKATSLLEGEACPEHLRGWEWHYLMRLRDGQKAPLRGHTTGLWGAEFSPDGKQIATCSIDGTLKFWDAESGDMIRSIDADRMPIDRSILEAFGVPRIPIMCLSYSPDGKTVATGSFLPLPRFNRFGLPELPLKPDRDAPGLVRLWNVETGNVILEFKDQKGVVLSLTYSPDGRFIASSSINPDNSFVVWDAGTGKVVQHITGHASHIHRLRFHPRGRLLAAGETSGIVKLWDLNSFEPVLTVTAHTAPVVGIDFSPEDGKRFATVGEDGLVRVWDTQSGERLLNMEGHAGSANDVRYSPDGTRIASSGFDKTVRIWDAETGIPKITLRGHEELVWGVAFSPDGQQIISAGFDNTLRIWDASPRTKPTLPGEFAVAGHTERANSVTASVDGRFLVSGSWDKMVRLWNAQTGAALLQYQGHEGAVFGVAVSADSRRIASAGWDHTARIWDRETGQLLLTFAEHTAPVHSVAFSPDGTRVASGAFDGQMKVWDTVTGKVIASGDGFIFPVMAVAFSPDGRRVASGGSDRNVKIWDAATGELLLKLPGHTASIHSLAFGPDGTRLATASWDHTARVWDVSEGRKPIEDRSLLTLTSHADRVNGVAFSSDGTRIATASEDKTVRLWDAVTGEEVAPPHQLRAVVWSVVFSSDNRRLAAAVWENNAWIRTWRIE